MKLERTIFLVTSDFSPFKKGDIIHQWGKYDVIKCATATIGYEYIGTTSWYYVEQNIDKIRYLTEKEIKKRKPHFNWLGKRLCNGYLYYKETLTTS